MDTHYVLGDKCATSLVARLPEQAYHRMEMTIPKVILSCIRPIKIYNNNI